MKNLNIKTFSMIVFILFSSLVVFGAVPDKMNFQGRLLDANKNPKSGTFSMVFSIWDSETGGTQIWSETQTNVQVTNGMFSVQLGAVNGLTANVFSNDTRWLQIQIGSEVLSPRERLVTSPYSFRASAAESVTAGAITDSEVSDTANISWTKISKTGSSLADLATRDAGDLNSGTLPSARLNGNYFNNVKVSSAIYADSAALISTTSALSSDITMATAGTWYNGPSVTLAPGTYLVTAQATMGFLAATAHYSCARITDDTNHYASGQQRPVATNPAVGTIHLSAIVTLTTTTTIRLQGVSNTANCLMRAQTSYASGNTATQITAVKIM